MLDRLPVHCIRNFTGVYRSIYRHIAEGACDPREHGRTSNRSGGVQARSGCWHSTAPCMEQADAVRGPMGRRRLCALRSPPHFIQMLLLLLLAEVVRSDRSRPLPPPAPARGRNGDSAPPRAPPPQLDRSRPRPPPPHPMPSPPMQPMPCGTLRLDGITCSNEAVRVHNQEYVEAGNTPDGRPWYIGVRDPTSFIFYDRNCGNHSSDEEAAAAGHMGWIIGCARARDATQSILSPVPALACQTRPQA